MRAPQEPTDALVRKASTAARGSDRHPDDVLGPPANRRDVLGRGPTGVVGEVDSEVTRIRPGRRPVVTVAHRP